MLKRFWAFLYSVWRTLWRRRQIAGVKYVASRSELPKKLGGFLYVVRKSKPRWVVLSCPCGCGERANARIGSDGPDSWRVTVGGGKVSLVPSILMTSGQCKSHFFVRDNRIVWV